MGDLRGGKYQELDFYGGTLTGIQEKLPYLKDMGIDIIYLNPIFRARSNHRYDTGNYTQVDPLCGTNTEFTELCEAAKKVGIRVMLDGVFSHTGEDSVYFNHFGHYPTLGAYQGQSSPLLRLVHLQPLSGRLQGMVGHSLPAGAAQGQSGIPEVHVPAARGCCAALD